MKYFAAAVLVCFMLIASDLNAGIGKPVASDSIGDARREELIDKIENNDYIRRASETAGRGKLYAVIERLPDSELVTVAENLDKPVAGGFAMTLGEAIAQLLLYIALLGVLVIVLFALGVVALFAGGAAVASTPSGAPMGKAQYEEQRKKVEDTKRLNEPIERDR